MKFQILIIFLVLVTLINIELSFGGDGSSSGGGSYPPAGTEGTEFLHTEDGIGEWTCPEDLKVFLKKSNGELACVKSSSIEKLINRGWGTSFENPLNIIVILTDDQRWDTICVDGIKNPVCDNLEEPPMPNIQNELVDKGFVFTNAHVTNPLCCPARASFLSGGFYSHNTGVLTITLPNGGAEKFSGYENGKIDDLTIATILQEHGYKTGLIGKYLNKYEDQVNEKENYAYIPPGWDDFISPITYGPNWTLINSVIGHNGIFERFDKQSMYVGEYEKMKSLDFIQNNCNSGKCDQPFFLLLSTIIPHHPAISNPNFPQDLDFGSDFTYRERGWNEGLRCDRKEMPDISDKPKILQGILSEKILLDINEVCNLETVSPYEKFAQKQLSTLRSFDRIFFDIYNELKEKNLLDQTVIIFTSDNGFLWGEHGLKAKQYPYEESIRVPLIIRLPTEEHKIVSDLVAYDIDLAPTILELAGIEHELIEKSDGSSLVPILKHSSEFYRDELLFEYFDDGKARKKGGSWAALKIFIDDETGNRELWKYIEYTSGDVELYNLNHDEFELDSLHKERLDLVEKISQKLDKLKGLSIVSYNFPDPYLYYLPPAVNGQNYNFQLNAWGGNGNQSWNSYETGYCGIIGFPSWINFPKFQTSGIISGIPTWGSEEMIDQELYSLDNTKPMFRDSKWKKKVQTLESEENMLWKFCVQVKSDGDSLHPNKNAQSHVKRLQINGTQN